MAHNYVHIIILSDTNDYGGTLFAITLRFVKNFVLKTYFSIRKLIKCRNNFFLCAMVSARALLSLSGVAPSYPTRRLPQKLAVFKNS